MKQFRILLPLLVLALIASGCGFTKTVTVNNKTLTVDTMKDTISDSTYTYQYTVSGDTITILYPDGARFWQTEREYGWSEDYDRFAKSGYTGGMTLTGAAAKAEDSRLTLSKLLPFLSELLMGCWLLLWPEKAWHYMGNNFLFHKDDVPSEGQIIWIRVWGVLLILMSVATLFQ